MAKWQEDKIESMLKEAVGDKPSKETLWALTLFAKHIRQRARNNAAFNNFMNRIFPHASFRQVPKVDDEGEPYEGLEITIK
jgi:hypothetical protein